MAPMQNTAFNKLIMNYYIGIDLGTSSVKTLIMTSNIEMAVLSQKDYDFDMFLVLT